MVLLNRRQPPEASLAKGGRTEDRGQKIDCLFYNHTRKMLYIVATPIGNLEDISKRARRVLSEVDYICAEDTRKAGLLLKKLNLPKKPYISFYEYNEEKRVEEIVRRLKKGESLALISNAGTPCISDPGYKLISRCRQENISVTSVPGACSVVNALVISGLPTDSFFFSGFLPRKSAQRRRKLAEIKGMKTTFVFMESPHRISKLLTDVCELLGNKRTALVREMTKIHEEVLAGKIRNIIEQLKSKKIKGEITIIIDNRND